MQTRIERVATANPAAFTGERRTNAVTGQRKAERDQRYLLAIGSAPAATGWVSPPGVENSWSIKLHLIAGSRFEPAIKDSSSDDSDAVSTPR